MNVDWKTFLSQHDLIYKRPGRIPQDGLPMGNGAMGVLAYAPFNPEFLINKNDVYDYRVPRRDFLTHPQLLAFMRQGGTADDLDRIEPVAHDGPYPTPKSCGLLRLEFGRGSTWAGGHRIVQRLSLADAAVRFALDKHLSHPRIESFVSRPAGVLAIRVSDVSRIGGFVNRIVLNAIPDAALDPARLRAEGDLLMLERVFPDRFRYALAVKVVPTGGTAGLAQARRQFRPQFVSEPTREVRGKVEWGTAGATVAGNYDLFAAVVTLGESRRPADAAREAVEQAAARGYRALFAEHRRWWSGFWRKSFLKLDQPMLEQLWYFSLYQLASSYGTTPVPGLCGLWYGPDEAPVQVAPWLGTYTNDQNSEMPPMPLFATNHAEFATSFYETFNRMIPALKRETRRLTGLDGVNFPNGLDPRGHDLTHGVYRHIQCAGPYHGLIYTWGYRYTRDRKLLRRHIYPFLREICVFFAEYMQLDETSGRYRLWPSVPAEINRLDVANPAQTLAMLKVCLRQAVEAARLLRVDARWVARWEDLLARYPLYPETNGILLEGEGIPHDHYTSQYGALYPVFPCGEFDADAAPAVKRLIRQTYRSYATRFTMRSYADDDGSHFFNGWTWFFDAMIALRMGWNREAWQQFWNQPLRCHLKPNGLFTHNAFAIVEPNRSEAHLARIPRVKVRDGGEWMPLSEPMHGNGGGECTPNPEAKETVASVHEMSSAYLMFINETLLQGHGGVLRVFPAVPRGFTGGFDRFRTEEALEVSAYMERGRTAFVTVRSLAGGTLRLRNPWPTGKVYVLHRGKTSRLNKPGREIVQAVRRGDRWTFYADARAWRRATDRRFGAQWPTDAPRHLPMRDGSTAWLGKPGS